MREREKIEKKANERERESSKKKINRHKRKRYSNNQYERHWI